MKISTSILNAKKRIECVTQLNRTNTNYIHIDVMDGKFVPDTQFDSFNEINAISRNSKYPLDIHLMVEKPIEYIEQLENMNIEYITFHLELNQNINEIISKIKEKGYKAGISIKPNTNIEEIQPYLKNIDLILVMSVEPGAGGQEFLPQTLEKISSLSKIIKENNYNIEIEVDGGIKDSNIENIYKSGATISVVGSYIINSNNYQEQINKLKKATL